MLCYSIVLPEELLYGHIFSGPRFTFKSSFTMFDSDDDDTTNINNKEMPRSRPTQRKKAGRRSSSYSWGERPEWNNEWNQSERSTPDFMFDFDIFGDGFSDPFFNIDKAFDNMFRESFGDMQNTFTSQHSKFARHRQDKKTTDPMDDDIWNWKKPMFNKKEQVDSDEGKSSEGADNSGVLI